MYNVAQMMLSSYINHICCRWISYEFVVERTYLTNVETPFLEPIRGFNCRLDLVYVRTLDSYDQHKSRRCDRAIK